MPKSASTDKLTPVSVHSHPTNVYVERSFIQQKLITPSEYRSTGQIG